MNGIFDRLGQEIPINDETCFKLWHPIDSSEEDILAWRIWLEEKNWIQPIKQAHREVYLLTDSEKNTRIYSNRFAAHIIKQHQFKALCEHRGWKSSLILYVDDVFPHPRKLIQDFGLQAEFWVEGLGDGSDTNEAGTFLYLTTDQVRFKKQQSPSDTSRRFPQENREVDSLPLVEVPPLVLSEIFRDIDLFIGVASVGNDPDWKDAGQNEHRDYWSSYSFGDLSEFAKIRREILLRLLPKTKIAHRCKLLDRFLEVQGSLRTYKIHLGSGNILMSPHDQYLCIVTAPKNTDQIMLPFEGDRVFSIILSKAMLLAEDDKIKDPTIVSQIKK